MMLEKHLSPTRGNPRAEAPRKQVAAMAKSDRKCANPNCLMFDKATNLSVCRRCHRATVHAIYRPRVAGRS
jgi:hypothetical protein